MSRKTPTRICVLHFKPANLIRTLLLVAGIAYVLACTKTVEINGWAVLKCGSHLPHAKASDRLLIKGVEVAHGALTVYSNGSCLLSSHPFGKSTLYCEDGGQTVIEDADCIWRAATPRKTFMCGWTDVRAEGNVANVGEWSARGVLLSRRSTAVPSPGQHCHLLLPIGYSSGAQLIYHANCDLDLGGILLDDGKNLQWDRLEVARREARLRASELAVTALAGGVYCK